MKGVLCLDFSFTNFGLCAQDVQMPNSWPLKTLYLQCTHGAIFVRISFRICVCTFTTKRHQIDSVSRKSKERENEQIQLT